VRNLEQSFWYKDQQLCALDRKLMTLIRRIGQLRRGLVDASRDLAARARLEVMNYAHNECVVSRQIFIAARGNV
jgi:hypothetical protein